MINRESYIIGCLIQDKATHVFLPKIKPYWFEGWNKEIIEFMQLSYLNNNPIDLVSLARQFKGKAFELTQFTNSYAYSTDLKHYLFELDIEYKKTQLIEKLSGLNTFNTLDLILKDIDLITQEANITIDKEPLPMSKVTAKVIDDLEQQMQRGEKLMGITTGWRMLDKYIGGWNKGNLVIIAGRPGSGKTAIALSLTISACQNAKVLFMSLEMSSEELSKRYISFFANIENYKIRGGNLKTNEHEHISQTLYRLQNDFFVDDDTKTTIADIRAKAQFHKAKHGLNILIIDYLQLIKGTKQNREQEIAEISRNLKIIAKDLGITVIALAQLSRKCEERADKRPMLSDLRESGSIEQDADLVMFPFRPQYYQQEQTDIENDCELIIGKNRHGSTITIPMSFEGKYTRYKEIL
jgi:replicative DNA helicase